MIKKFAYTLLSTFLCVNLAHGADNQSNLKDFLNKNKVGIGIAAAGTATYGFYKKTDFGQKVVTQALDLAKAHPYYTASGVIGTVAYLNRTTLSKAFAKASSATKAQTAKHTHPDTIKLPSPDNMEQ